ncbi:acetolactate synthase [Corynebacterium sp. HMSC065D07]|uniref:thiamine pyrophosphate-dependent enzyme n=1 Tax=unclassified Corynebacterium TaxID=2624378 RepID=UPI0008A4E5F2|nr:MULTISPECIES: thiamine pyrophosphate-dependent enzyme [unclassified Corynebacterium]MDK8896388.1 thiamine pyrophosphate-binding protein [Corynebacterium sp. MSK004]OFL60390.1 acetolactate synthase [Corynebacterium sp. HMSC065D07]OFN17143.1 acetolactate synthase [Corynebacterium sp. HMSC055A01]
MSHVGAAIAASLAAHNVPRAFLVPGESFLPVLDGLYDSPVEAIVCRHEGGATYMAEAQGKATGQPGVAMVTRGPGAANAYVGIHTAWQDATPLVLFVGLIPTSDRDRESFQEFDPKAWFGTQAKQVFVLDDPERASRVVAEAFFQAQQGRPGPVIVGLPEDVLHKEFTGTIHPPIPVAEGALSDDHLGLLSRELSHAERPLIFAGGPRWTPETAEKITRFAEEHRIPIIQDFRAADRVPFDSPANAGWLGYGRDPRAAQLLEAASLVIEVGAVLGDVPTDGYTLRQSPQARNIAINPDTSLRGHSVPLESHIVASPVAFANTLDRLTVEGTEQRGEWFDSAHANHLNFATLPEPADYRPGKEGTAHMEAILAALHEQLPKDSIYTFGAGNHCIWAQQFLRSTVYPSQFSVRNGSMGYSIPAAVSTKLQFPERTVVTIAGDGEYLMNGQELATALQYGAPFLIIVMSNGEFGTIRDHQKKHFPDRVSGTQLVNPDFAAVARGFGAHGELVTDDAQAPEAVARALAAIANDGVPALINVITDQEHSLPIPPTN